MVQYFTNIVESQLNQDFIRRPIEHISKSFESFSDFGWSLGHIIIFPCKFAFLAIAVFIEAIISLGCVGYYRCKAMQELCDQNHADARCAILICPELLVLFVASLLQTLVFLFRLISTFLSMIARCIHRDKRVHAGSAVRSSTANCDHPVVIALDKYADLIEQANHDRETIAEERFKCRAEFKQYKLLLEEEVKKKALVLAKSGDASVTTISHFKADKKMTEAVAQDQRKNELIEAYITLADTYPVAEFQTWKTRAERRPITLREAEQAYTDFEAHHQKLLDVAKQMLEACNIPLKEIGVWMDQNLNGAQGIGYRS